MDKQISNHIKNGGIQIKKKNQLGGKNNIKLSPMSQNYKLYLQEGGVSKNSEPKKNIKKIEKIDKIEQKKIQITRNSSKKSKINDPIIKIIHHKENKRKHKFTRKKPSKIKNIKDINEIESQIELKKKNESMKEIQSNPIKKSKGVRRQNKRSNKNKGKKESRKVSMKKSKKITEKDIIRVQKHIEYIRSKKTEEIKTELEKEGIKVSGKSKRLLKDIYLYSKICGINIRHEK